MTVSRMRAVFRVSAGFVVTVVFTTACAGGGDGSGGGGSGGGGGTPISLATAGAIWIDAGTIVWPGADNTRTYSLFYATNAGLAATTTSVSGADNPSGDGLTVTTLSAAQKLAFPQFASATALTVPAATVAKIKSVLTGELAVIQYTGAAPALGTQVQTGPVLDAVYGAAASSAELGVSFDPVTDIATFRLWAPTAKSVTLNVYPTSAVTTATTLPMAEDPVSGVWSYAAPDATWTNMAYYTYSVTVFSRAAANAVVTNTVTDPYSLSLNANSQHSMVVNLADLANPAIWPSGWPGALIPTAAAPTDSVIYELHVRDFSLNDPAAVMAHKGKFLAFTDPGSNGMQHLSALAGAGLTHVHLLPAFDISTVDEVNCQQSPAITASTGAGTQAEMTVKATQGTDCFNWGYDPFHYGAPEGSYSTDPNNGLVRVKEFRQMVRSLHGMGLRVIMDVVYNHTSDHGQSAHSVLDQIVPGYYYRLDGAGNVESNSCCSDTATERTMMAKLMIDTLQVWAGQYKVDGFRFDVMSLIPKAVMTAALAAVDTVAAADGRGHTYFFGEGFTPGSQVTSVIAPSTQLSMAGTGIGTFNDRLRDGARGGGPFDTGGAIVANQGFINGLCYDLNSANTGCTDPGFTLQNRISVGLAGNLASFPLNATTKGNQVDYFGSPTGYTTLPQENIAYVSVHDNETLFDISQYKHPAGISLTDTGRAQAVGLSLVALAQGVPFIHAADDLLRSKSGDGNSYDSGDYFNRIYWDGSPNNWSVGLPPDNTGNNGANAATLGPLLSSKPIPSQAVALATSAAFQDFLKIRRSTDFFRLRTATDINNCVTFPDQGAQVHGLIVERIVSAGSATCTFTTTSPYKSVVVLYNASKTAQSFGIPAYANKSLGTVSGSVNLHAVQAGGSDAVLTSGGWNFTANATSGIFTAPARTTAVFVEYQ